LLLPYPLYLLLDKVLYHINLFFELIE